jgi:hypothetical protein
MARQTGLLRFSGKLGNTVGYERGGRVFTRTAGETYELTEESKKSAIEFGRGSSASALVRQAFSAVLLEPFKKDPQNRLAERFREVIRRGHSGNKGNRTVFDGDVGLLRGFEFNCHAGFHKLVSFQPKAEITANSVELIIPEFTWQRDVYAPEKANSVVLGAICGAFDFKAKQYETTQTAKLIIDNGDSLVERV